jgi:glycosyltransferase involved in cell wall biosynthesis
MTSLSKNKQPKILYFIQLPPPVHGVSIINRLIYASQKINQGFSTYLLEIKFSNRIDQLRRLNIRKIYQFLKLILNLIRSIRSIRPDIIYFSLMPVGKGLLRDLFFVLIIKWYKVTPVYHLHNKGIERNSKRWILRKLYEFIFRDSYIIHLSRSLYDHEMSRLKLKNSKFRIIPNGISKFKHIEAEKQNNAIKLLYLSNLFPQKGILDLIEIYNILVKRNPDIVLSVVGGFPYRKTHQQVIQLIRKYNLEDKILMKGPRYGRQKSREYNQADIFIYPTTFRQECFPLVILEAMQSGLPIIASDEGAISEIIDNGTNGIVLCNWTAESFSSEIEALIKNETLRLKLGENAKKKFIELYTVNTLEQNMMNFFEEEFLK